MLDKLNYENVLHVLMDSLNSSTKQNDREIAKSLLDNFKDIPELSIEALAYRCYSSQPTLTRYIKKLGYQNYNEFKDYVIDFLKVMENEVNNDIFTGSKTDAILLPFEQAIDSITKTKSLVNETDMRACARQIYDANRIVIIGIDYSELVAFDAQLRFMRYNVVMETAVKTHEQTKLVESLNDGDLLIVLSVSGYTKGLKAACKNIDPNCNVILVTSSENPDILSTHHHRSVLNITSDINVNVNSSLSGRINLLMIIDSLYIMYGKKYLVDKKI